MELSNIERLPLSVKGDTPAVNGTGSGSHKSNLSSRFVHDLAAECGFDLVGVASASPVPDFDRFRDWADRGLAGEMRYLTDHRAEIRGDLGRLLPGVRSVICTGTLYNGPEPHSTEFTDPERAWISRYAWGEDYHESIQAKLKVLGAKLKKLKGGEWRSCVDTAPLLERSLARQAGLGWIGKNTCLISQTAGSWFFLGEVLTTLELEPDSPPPDRCGTCTRCIDACPTTAIVPSAKGGFELDARRCIAYFTIELRSSIPEEFRVQTGNHIFGCDICQDVCPWNGRAATDAPPAREELFAPPLDRLAGISKSEFIHLFRGTAATRSKYNTFLRNIAIAMGNSGQAKYRQPLERLAVSDDPLVAEHARWAIGQLSAISAPKTTAPDENDKR